MERYSLVSMRHVYDAVDNKLIDVSTIRGEIVTIPQFLWTASILKPETPMASVGLSLFTSERLGVVGKKANTLTLKDFNVTVAASQKNAGRTVQVRSLEKDRFYIESLSERIAFTQRVQIIRQIGSNIQDFQHMHGTSVPSVYRVYDGDLPYRVSLSFQNNHMPYGLTQQKYSIWYKGKKLNGWSYVFFAGNIIILLGDNFTFDSFALWSGQTPEGELVVERFAYSVNPYIVKMMTLLG